MLIYCTIIPEVRLSCKIVEWWVIVSKFFFFLIEKPQKQIIFIIHHFVHLFHHLFIIITFSQISFLLLCYNSIQEQIGNKQTKREIEWNGKHSFLLLSCIRPNQKHQISISRNYFSTDCKFTRNYFSNKLIS